MDIQYNNTNAITLPAYAKINLFLHIVGQRQDGYHLLQSWFQFIDLKDQLTFLPTKDDNFSIQNNIIITKLTDNLIFKAAQLIKPYAKRPCGIEVILNKKIPMGAGLGGGSANAATTLIALNKLWHCDLDQAQLITLGQKLGADIPIFIFQKAAWAEGIGEKLTYKPYKEQYALIIKPNFHASTALLFQHPALNKNHPILNSESIDDPLVLDNGFLPVIQSIHPEIFALFENMPDKEALRLTGTGACFYLLSPDFDRLQQNRKKLKKEVDSWIVKTLNFAPVKAS
ncbi:4-(cytidine 5'-diphospho)-2-C-methyl-D-erythritol kinase [Facilibium subflavum]|uniref:4-(cytidine 5'-diphospho)-2-C-methyl-D-erythritol kinase n=1 Tax=Facilibium subflavum TaxID=2219058 RepID=UPI000E650FD7|nr:4-(cytidine 5'-diphospho)-2-C-methyl-D-erythritol kinase [Facilibium subflavum]